MNETMDEHFLKVEYNKGYEDGKREERERIEKQFVWGQVPYHDIGSDTTKEWTMRCISDEDWQALTKGETDDKETTNGKRQSNKTG